MSLVELGKIIRKPYTLAVYMAFLTPFACQSEEQVKTDTPDMQQAGCHSDEECRSGRECIESKCSYPQVYDAAEDAGFMEAQDVGQDAVRACLDADGDGYYNVEGCGTLADCDDEKNNIYPGASEKCDGFDNNCNNLIDEGVRLTFFYDNDDDGFGDPDVIEGACSPSEGYVDNGNDCNDNEMHINPAAEEICDGFDNNCNNRIDEGVLNLYFRDVDGDSFGNPFDTIEDCSLPGGYSENGDDCDDRYRDIHPDAEEVCDRRDNNCDGAIDSGCDCVMEETRRCGSTNIGECGYGIQACDVQGIWGNCIGNVEPIVEACDGLDNDCDGDTDEGLLSVFYRDRDEDGFGNELETREACQRPVGYVINSGDCDDRNAQRRPGLEEVCDGLDNNCSGIVDEGVLLIFYHDGDGDGYGNSEERREACSLPRGYAGNDQDCDDQNPWRNPGQSEICDGLDNDCDMLVDEGVLFTFYRDADGDGFGDPEETREACHVPMGYVEDNTDCDDGKSEVHPQHEEICDLFDNDCDLLVDEGVQIDLYMDWDRDGFGDVDFRPWHACEPIEVDGVAYIENNRDCNDLDREINPAAPEVCDFTDNNCDERIDEGYNVGEACHEGVGGCRRNGEIICSEDELDSLCSVVASEPEIEICDEIDNDCDGRIDEMNVCQKLAVISYVDDLQTPGIYLMYADGRYIEQIADNDSSYISLAVSPDGTKIAFDRDEEIYSMNPDGSIQMNLTHHLGLDLAPSWSPPDDRKIVFLSERDGNREVYIMHRTGANQRNLTNNPASDSDADFSPDGRKIVFVSDRQAQGYCYALYTMDSDGDNLQRLSDSCDDFFPSWSPDGRKIAFIRGFGNIYVMDADGSNDREIFHNDGDDFYYFLKWSPDGGEIYMLSDLTCGIYVINSVGGDIRTITEDRIEYFDLFPER